MSSRTEKYKRAFGIKRASRKAQLFDARKKRESESKHVLSATTDADVSFSNLPDDCEIENSFSKSATDLLEDSDFVESAMQRKFRLLEQQLYIGNKTDVAGKPTFLLFDTRLLKSLFNNLGCSECKSFGNLTVEFNTEHMGLAAELSVICSFCKTTIVKTTSSKRSTKMTTNVKKTALEVNRRATLASIYTGYGYRGMEKFSMIMGMPVIHQKTFAEHSLCINTAVQETVADILAKSAESVRNAYAELGIFPDNNGILDIAVSYDGSWMKRGHTSNFGIGVAIDLLTGLVLDFEVLSRYCHACALKKKKVKQEEFAEWFENHKVSCNKTFNGTAGAMEATASLTIWRRSIKKHMLRYTELLSDGDAKTFQILTENQVYGPDHIIIKEECINHVGKRMFTALSKTVTENRSRGITLGGKGHGKLTHGIQEKLSHYYRKAIRNNAGDIKSMRDAVFATLFHSVSTDEQPHHSRCPKGPDSWCFFNKSLALGKTPGKHIEYVHTFLKKEVAEKIIPIYQRLGDETLLSRCLKGKTQNANESLHSVIWNRCPKVRFLHMDRVNTGVGLSIIDFNYGHQGIQVVLQKLGIEPGLQTNVSSVLCDTKRLSKSAERATAKVKRSRHVKHMAQVRLEQRLEEEEGNPSYEAGGFT